MDASSSSSSSSELKRSCEDCSSSKVKCSQDKPACKRCRKHKIVCTYAPAKRIGRPRKIRKDDESSQLRTTRLLASAPSRPVDLDRSPTDSSSLFSEDSMDQCIFSDDQSGLAPFSCFGLDGAGYACDNTDVVHLVTESHLIDHGWCTNAHDLDTLWGTPLHQGSYLGSGCDNSDGELGSCGLQGGDRGFVNSTWKQRHKTFRTTDSQDFYMDIDLQKKIAENALLSIYSQEVQFGTWEI